FALPGVDGKTHRLDDFQKSKALVVIFMCNHCPYVIAVQSRINALARGYAARGVALVGINSNDSSRYPDDNFEAMKARAKEQGYVFPYLHDESQMVARAYGAVCTPDIFVYAPASKGMVLKYRGRIDDNWKDERAVSKRDLAEALDAIVAGHEPRADQVPSMGCSIKWK
ncbi:MAG: thioredoxin family protein, partial [Bdellovibrionota bacterium]